MNTHLSPMENGSSEDALATLLACWLEGAFDLQEACALTGYGDAEFENLANDAAVLNRVARARALPHFGPFLARLKAKRYISKAVDRLKDIIDDPDTSAGSIAKATEMLYAISRMRSEDGARENAARTEPFHLRINLDDRNGHSEAVEIIAAPTT